MKRTILICVLAFILCHISHAQSVTIGAWNIQWLGTPENRNGVEQTAEDIARYISESGVSVLALEEISDTDNSAPSHTNRILDRAFEQINSSGGNRWHYICYSRKRIRASLSARVRN